MLGKRTAKLLIAFLTLPVFFCAIGKICAAPEMSAIPDGKTSKLKAAEGMAELLPMVKQAAVKRQAPKSTESPLRLQEKLPVRESFPHFELKGVRG